jgi:hypothetical protein
VFLMTVMKRYACIDVVTHAQVPRGRRVAVTG